MGFRSQRSRGRTFMLASEKHERRISRSPTTANEEQPHFLVSFNQCLKPHSNLVFSFHMYTCNFRFLQCSHHIKFAVLCVLTRELVFS